MDKELFGDTFRAPPRLTPLEARAIRLALEFVGPMIAADAHTPLDRVRRKLEETFGEFELAQTPEPRRPAPRRGLVATLSAAIRERRLVEIEYQKEGEEEPTHRVIEPYQLERELPYWYVHTWDRTRDGDAASGSTACAGRTHCASGSSRRAGFEPQRFAGHADRPHLVLARGRPLGGRAGRHAARRRLGGARDAGRRADWLIGEILSFRGEAVVLEPTDLRKRVATRAKELARELNLSRVTAAAS